MTACPDCDHPTPLVAGEDLTCGLAVSIDPTTGRLHQRRPGPSPHYWHLVDNARAGDVQRTGIGNHLRRKEGKEGSSDVDAGSDRPAVA